MKKLLSCLVAFVLVVTSFSVVSLASSIYSYKEEIPISDSITLFKVKDFHSGHNISYSYIEADLSDENTSLELLKSSKGTDILETVPALSQGNENVVASLNADFFSVFSGNKGFALGMEIKDGEVKQSNINPDTMATVYYDGDALSMAYINLGISVAAPNGEKVSVRHLNKHTSYFGDVLMYTSDYNGGFSPAPGGEVVEVVVSDGKITEFRRNLPPVEIPQKGCVFVVSEGVNMFFANNFNVGDEIDIQYSADFDLDKIETAFGAGAFLVTNGVKNTTFSHVISGNNPRSALGIDKSGKKLYLLAVDGRQSSSKGMTMSELAELMVGLGCYNAVNLDGGGSTNMQASTIWNKNLHAVNSPTENRKVINAVGLVYNAQPSDADGISVKVEEDVTFIGQPVTVTASVYDKNKRPLGVAAELKSNDGIINGNEFTPINSGYVTIKASYGGVKGEAQVYVIDKISGIDVDSHMRLNIGDKKDLEINVYDRNGYYAQITDASRFRIKSSNPSVAEVSGRTVRAKSNGTAVIEVEKDGVKSYCSVAVGSYSYEYNEVFSAPNGTFKGYPSNVRGDFVRDNTRSVSDSICGKLIYDFTEESSTDSAMAAYYRLDDQPTVGGVKIQIDLYTKDPFPYELCVQFIDSKGNLAISSFGSHYESGKWQTLSASVPADAVKPIKLDSVYVRRMMGEDKLSGTVYIDNLKFSAQEKMSYESAPKNIYADESDISDANETITFGYTSNGENTLLLGLLNKRMGECVYDKKGIYLDNTQFGAKEDARALYISVDSSKGGIRKTDSNQWDKLRAALETSGKDNVFIFSSSSLFGNDEFENEVLKDYLATLDKNIFVITRGKRNTHMCIDGVDYFTLGSSDEEEENISYLDNFCYLAFDLNNNVSFEFKPCFTKK